ncbi:MAG: hypothetical protein JWQ43_2617 [Glaciihabitans sp.]|nr:hypothetical protein [Glaciihabitans sp.]
MGPLIKCVAKRLLPARAQSRIRRWRIDRGLRKFPAYEVTRQYGGFELRLRISDGLAHAWYGQDTGPLPEIEFLRRFQLRSGSRVFDLGAHQGVVALVLARIVAPDGSAIAVEANEHNAAMAMRNRDLSGAANLRVIHGAASNQPGYVTFNESLNGRAVSDGSADASSIVPAVTVDQLASQFGDPDVVFVDVEGFEGRVLEGAARMLGQADFMIEVHVGCGLEAFGCSVDQLTSFFGVDRYQLYMASDAQPEPVVFDPESELVRGRFYLTAVVRRNAELSFTEDVRAR